MTAWVLNLQTAGLVVGSVAHWLGHLVSNSPLTYAIVVADVALDAVFPFVQSEAVVISAAVFASHGRLAIWLILPAAAVGAFIGDNCLYVVGCLVGPAALRGLFRGDRGVRGVAWTQRTLHHHAALAIGVGRFLPGGRNVTTFASGALGIGWRRFALADALASVLWATYASMLGYFAGKALRGFWPPLVVALGVATVISGVAEAYRRMQKRQAFASR